MTAPRSTRRLWLITQYATIPLLLIMVTGGPALLPTSIASSLQPILTTMSLILLATLAASGVILANRTYQLLQASLQEQKRFVANASHHLRTPTTALRTLLEVSQRDPALGSPEFQDILARSLNQVGIIQQLTDELLELASYDQRQPHFSQIRLDVPIHTAIKSLQPLADTKSINIGYVPASHRVRGNARDLTRLISILLENAIKYSQPHSSVKVQTTRARNKTIITVADQGIGIPEEDQGYIFQRFYRSQAAHHHHSTTGFGLGLAIADEITKLHKGKISVSSAPGTGSVFTVELPAA